MTIHSFHDSQFYAMINHADTCGNQSMHMPRCDITCISPCSCGFQKGMADLCVYQLQCMYKCMYITVLRFSHYVDINTYN